MARTNSWSVAGRVFGVQVLAVAVIAAALLVLLAIDARQSVDADAAATSLAVSRTIAASADVQHALMSEDPTATLQPYAIATMESAEVDFVTIMDPDGIRYTHPNPDQIGKPFLGTIEAAQRGETLTETYTGTLGPSVRAVVPIMFEGELVGMVSAGVTTANVTTALLPRIPFVIGLAILVVVLGAGAAALTRRSLRRMTGGMAPDQLRRMVEFYQSVLHSVREGVVLTDERRRVVLYNDEAADLLGLPPAPAVLEPASASELGVDADVAALLNSGRRAVEETRVAGGRLLLVNQEWMDTDGDANAHSAVMTLRDQSRLQELVGELESVRTMSKALRSQAHEHSNTLHTIAVLLGLGRTDDVAQLVAASSRTSQSLADAVVDATADPVMSGLLLGKSATASERGVAFEIDLAEGVTLPLMPSELVTVAGNLIDNALEAVRDTEPPRWIKLRLAQDDANVTLEVTDSGPGPSAGLDVFGWGVTTKSDEGSGHGLGLALVRRIVEAYGGSVEFHPGAPTRVVVTLPRPTAP
jgi:two-component system CitB family sensor kinase